MPSIILPRRSFGQPQGLRRVDPRWAPVYVGSAGAGFVNQAAPSVQPAIAGASLVAIQSGVAYRNTSSAFSVNTRQGAFPAGQGSARTFVVQYIMRGAGGGAFGRLIEKRNAGSQIETLIHNSGSIRYDRTGSGGTQSCWVSAGGATTIGQLNTLVISVPEFATGSPTAALNGVAVTPDTATAGFGTATTNTDEYYIGNRGDGTRNWDGEIALVAMLGRAVSQEEAIALSADPWQLFRQPERRLYFDTSSSSGNITVSGKLAIAASDSIPTTSILGSITFSAKLVAAKSVAIATSVSVAGGSGTIVINKIAAGISTAISGTVVLGSKLIQGVISSAKAVAISTTVFIYDPSATPTIFQRMNFLRRFIGRR